MADFDDRDIEAGPIKLVHVVNQSASSGGGGGTPADPSETNITQIGGVAVTNPLDVNIQGRDDETDAPTNIAVRPLSGGTAGAVFTTLIDTGNSKTAALDVATGITEGDDLLAVHDPTIGLAADTAVTTGAGTVSGKLRGLVETITAVYLSAAAALRITGSTAHDAVDAGNPVAIGGYGADTPPADVSTVGDRVKAWIRRNGALAIYDAYGHNITDDIVRALSPGVVIRPTITISATPDYSIGDGIGGIITLSGVMEASGRQARLHSITVKENSGQAPALTFIFFRATPASGTYTDNAAIAWGATDSGNMVGEVQVLTTDYYVLASKSIATLGNIGQLMGSATSDLYLIIAADSAYNAAATTDLTIEFAFERM